MYMVGVHGPVHRCTWGLYSAVSHWILEPGPYTVTFQSYCTTSWNLLPPAPLVPWCLSSGRCGGGSSKGLGFPSCFASVTEALRLENLSQGTSWPRFLWASLTSVLKVGSVPDEKLMTLGHGLEVLADLIEESCRRFSWHESCGERCHYSRASLGTLFLALNLIFY